MGRWALALALLTSAIAVGVPSRAEAAPVGAPLAACTNTTGPGIPPPVGFATGIPGFHAHWYGQSGYPTLCPGATSTAVVAYYNTGTFGWVRGRMGEVAYLGTWDHEPGQDRPSPLGGDGTAGSPATGWPRYNRIAMQPADYVGPGQVAWFQFTIRAPSTPGFYRLYLRPLIEGARWMEDFGVFWLVTVLNPDGTRPPDAPAVYTPIGYSRTDVPTPAGTFTTWLIKERLTDVRVRTLSATSVDCAVACPAKPLAQYVAESGAYAGMHGSYFCPPDYAPCAGKVNTFDYAVYDSSFGRWVNGRHLTNPTNALMTFNGSSATAYRRIRGYGGGPVTAGISNFPLVLQGGALLDVSAEIDVNQARRGTRGAIGVDGTHVYLATIASASVPEISHVMRAIGARDAMNLDGGGSVALWIGGGYKVGPGRLLPNAIVLLRP